MGIITDPSGNAYGVPRCDISPSIHLKIMRQILESLTDWAGSTIIIPRCFFGLRLNRSCAFCLELRPLRREKTAMDPITTVLVAAAPYLADKVGGHLIKDAYEGFKGWLKGRLGQEHEATRALDSLEQRPTSEGYKMVLQESLAKTGLVLDEEGKRLFMALRQTLPNTPGTLHNIQINVHQVSGGQVGGIIHNHGRDDSR